MKILIALLFKNSFLWLDRFMVCIEDLLKDYENNENIRFDFSVIYGDSTDPTDIEVKKRMEELKEKYLVGVKIVHIPLPKRLDGIEKLAILRNASITIVDIENYDYVLQIDTDIIFDHNSIDILIKDIEEGCDKKIGVIAPLVFIEGTKTFYDTWAFRMDGGKMFRPDIINWPGLSNGKIFEVDSVGTCCLIKSDIFWKWDIKYGTEERKAEERKKMHPQRRLESEQVVWCNRVREKTGYKIMVDSGIRIDHINLEKYGKRWH